MARVFLQTLADRLLFMGVTGEVWMAPGVTQSTALARQAPAYQNGHPSGQVTLLLGAGNAGFMAPDDVLTHCAYCSGAHARHAALIAGHAKVRHFADPPADHLPWALIDDVNPNLTTAP